jgi:hypothetical protein
MAPPLQTASARAGARVCRAGARVCMVGLIASVSAMADAAQTAPWPARPPLSAACDAWNVHIQDLLDQHQWLHEISEDVFGTALSLFYAAQAHCALGDEKAAFEMYERIPLARPTTRALH